MTTTFSHSDTADVHSAVFKGGLLLRGLTCYGQVQFTQLRISAQICTSMWRRFQAANMHPHSTRHRFRLNHLEIRKERWQDFRQLTRTQPQNDKETNEASGERLPRRERKFRRTNAAGH